MSAAASPPTGPHGGDVVAVARWLGVDRSDICDLSANVNPFAPDVVSVVARALPSIADYADATRATAIFAEALGVDVGRVVLTNGGAEAIALVARLMPTGWVERPEFSLYERHLTTLDPDAPRWRSNPSSPLGILAAPDETAGVWDEAYWHMATGTWTRGDDDTWRVGSLTKLWSCLGLRIGYVIAPDTDLAARIAELQPRWSVNPLACAAVETLVPRSDLSVWAHAIALRRRELVGVLAGHGLEVRDTDACWVLVRRPGLRAELVRERVLVRDCASFGLDGWHRLVVPDDHGLEMLELALSRIAG